MRPALLAALAASGHALRVPYSAPRAPCRERCGAPLLVASQTDAIEQAIQQTTATNDVVIYSKSWCPYCMQCKALFDDLGTAYTAIELDEREDGAEVQAALLSITQQRTVPNVFISGQHVGGNDDTQRLARSGKLAELLEAGAAVGRVLPTGSAASATAAQMEAVASGKMITETEATIRKVAGVGMGLATAFQFFTSGLAYTTLSAGIFGALSVYRSGAAYQ